MFKISSDLSDSDFDNFSESTNDESEIDSELKVSDKFLILSRLQSIWNINVISAKSNKLSVKRSKSILSTAKILNFVNAFESNFSNVSTNFAISSLLSRNLFENNN